jgi:SAM-dependent methyltransferase
MRETAAFGLVLAVVLSFGCSRNSPAEPPADIPASPAAESEPPVLPPVESEANPTAGEAPSASEEPAGGDAGEALAETPERAPDIEYVPTPQNVVDKMLDAAKLTKNDVLYDLGCGDGRIVVTAAKKYGVKARGFDIDPVRVRESRENVKKAGVEDLVTIEQKDIFTIDLTPASVVTLYLLPELNVRLIPQLEKLRKGARIVSHDFDMEGVTPEKTWTVLAADHRPPPKDREHYVYLWKTPLKRAKAR